MIVTYAACYHGHVVDIGVLLLLLLLLTCHWFVTDVSLTCHWSDVSVAAMQVWKLSSVDQCEIARNSVLQVR